jgi:glycosyltransferase involved in cell wall biosynthesis
MTRVAIVTTEPTASRVPQFDLLAKRDDLEIMVYYAAESVQGRMWKLTLDHPHEILQGPNVPLTRVLHHDYPITPSLWGKLDRGNYDCVVVWGWSTFAAQVAVLWCRRKGVPYVLFAESHLAEPRRAWVRAAKHLLVPLAVRHAAAWLATGTLARRHLVHYGADPARIWTFANTVDVGVLAARAAELRPRRDEIRARLGLPAEGVVVLHAGRLLPVKAVDVLIEAAAQAGSVHLLIVGDGPERNALERAAARAGVGSTFTGFLAEQDLVETYVAADVFALLSRRETWGVVVNEAAACGLPLVLSHGVGAATDLLVAGVNGELVPVDDVNATASALHLLARDPERRRKQGLRSTEISASWGYGSTIESFGIAVRAALADAQETAVRGDS